MESFKLWAQSHANPMEVISIAIIVRSLFILFELCTTLRLRNVRLENRFLITHVIYVKGNHLHCNAIPHVFSGNVGIRFFHFFSSNCIAALRMSPCVCSSAVHAVIVRTTAKALPESSCANEESAVKHMRSFIWPLARATPRPLQTADKAILKHHGNRR